MKYNPDIHHRRSIRLRGYDYGQEGAYFVTICVKDKRHLFGEIENGEMMLNGLGQIAHQAWEKLPERWPHLELGAFQIMPNHIHGIVIIHPTTVGAPLAGAQHHNTQHHNAQHHNTQHHSTQHHNAQHHNTQHHNAQHHSAQHHNPQHHNAQNPTPKNQITQEPSTPKKRPTQIQWATKPTIGQITGAYKSCVLTESLKWVKANEPGKRLGKLWQRNMWEVIIRNATAFDNITNYIINNPKTWEEDRFFSAE